VSKFTALHGKHTNLGAKMGEFAGYDMPLYYDLGVKKEHEWVRSSAGLFDVSHMGQMILDGSGVVEFLEYITPSSFSKKKIGRAQYTVLTNENGSIVDDLIITKVGDNKFFVVFNAGCKDKDIEWIKSHMPESVNMEVLDRVLIALQGPKAAKIIDDTLQCDVSDMPYMSYMEVKSPCGQDIFISRLGYTGEDGFELSLPGDVGQRSWVEFLKHEAVEPIGLAARDSLRLEMGYCLYGHDIDDKTTPLEADLGWVMGKDNKSYIGADKVTEPKRKRVGIRILGKGVAREGAEIRTLDDKIIGSLSSGGFSPTLGQSIGQGYVPIEYASAGTKIYVNVRGRNIEAEIAKMPFVTAKTKSMKAVKAA